MNADDLKKRTKQFGLRVIKVTDSLPAKRSAGKNSNREETKDAKLASGCGGKPLATFEKLGGLRFFAVRNQSEI